MLDVPHERIDHGRKLLQCFWQVVSDEHHINEREHYPPEAPVIKASLPLRSLLRAMSALVVPDVERRKGRKLNKYRFVWPASAPLGNAATL
jgi:hypothetical protein